MCTRDRLVIDHLALARWHANRKKICDPALDYDDLYQSACIGLIKAADTWDSNQSPFAAWATVKIRGEIMNELRRMKRVRVPLGESHPTWEPLKDVIAEEPREPNADIVNQANHLLSWLSAGTRTMMRLHLGLEDGQEWPATRIASEFGCSHTTVDNRILSAIQLLRTKDQYE